MTITSWFITYWVVSEARDSVSVTSLSNLKWQKVLSLTAVAYYRAVLWNHFFTITLLDKKGTMCFNQLKGSSAILCCTKWRHIWKHIGVDYSQTHFTQLFSVKYHLHALYRGRSKILSDDRWKCTIDSESTTQYTCKSIYLVKHLRNGYTAWAFLLDCRWVHLKRLHS